MAGWRRCDRCRKVLPEDGFDGAATSCQACLAGPQPRVRAPRASAVTTARTKPAPEPAGNGAPMTRAPLLGVAGSGDLEVRERRARRAALDGLAQQHPEEFDQLLLAARRTEGLRT